MPRSPLTRLVTVGVALAAMLSAAVVARQAPPPVAPMADAARKFLRSLDDEQRAQATFPLDSPERDRWFFTPMQAQGKPLRKGVRLDRLSPEQKSLTMTLLKSGLSDKGFAQAETIMQLERVLRELERNGSNTRNPEWYFVSVFGDPTATGDWSWRIEGHHLSVNVTLGGGQVQSATPMLFASNPAEVRQGSRKGLKTLTETQDAANALIQSLTPEQTRLARRETQFPEIQEGVPTAGVGNPEGVPAGQLAPDQLPLLTALLDTYLARLSPDLAAEERARLAQAGREKVHFAYCIEDEKPGKPMTYRVQGPTFVVEFLNVQADSAGNPANHIHSGWRRLPRDFTLPAR